MSDDPRIPPLPAGLPGDWVQPEDLPCPRCRYNLRMLRLPRCPECGYAFRWQQLLGVRCPRCGEPLYTWDAGACPRCRLPLDWEALLAEALRCDRRLYEYADRPLRTIPRTFLLALRPSRLWAHIRLEMSPATERLRRLRRIAIAVAILGLAALMVASWQGRLPAGWRQSSGDPLERYDDFFLVGPVLALPLVTMIGLPLFIPTLARFRVRDDQLLRCLAYGSAGLFWLGLILLLAALVCVADRLRIAAGFGPMATVAWRARSVESLHFVPDWLEFLARFPFQAWARSPAWTVFHGAIVVAVLVFGFVWWWMFLYIALRRYLKLDAPNARALFLSTQICAGLVLLLALESTYSGAMITGRLLWWLGGLLGLN